MWISLVGSNGVSLLSSETETEAASRDARLQPDPSAMGFDNGATDGKADAGPLFLAADKGIENPVPDRGRNARSGIGNQKMRGEFVRRRDPPGQPPFRLLAHGVDGMAASSEARCAGKE